MFNYFFILLSIGLNPHIFLILKKPVSLTDTGFYIATHSCISSVWS